MLQEKQESQEGEWESHGMEKPGGRFPGAGYT
jgi:hypothetical protein